MLATLTLEREKMTLTRNLLSDAVRYGLTAGAVGLMGLAANPAFAQDTTTTPPAATPEQKAKNLERIEVVGSRIKRAVDYESTSPVTTLTRADIEQTGLTTTFDIINHISASDGTGLSTVTTQTNGSDGTQTISLRNLGAQRTLVLVDGKRWPTDANGIVDLSTIPVAIIERIEVLKDGASAIYGSDAIAGVVNIITRKKYEGAQIGWYYGETSHGDGGQNSEDVTIGAASERSSGVLSLSRSEFKPIFAGNRKQSDASIFGCDQLLSNWPTSDPNSDAGFCGSSTGQFGRLFVPGIGNVALDNSFHDSGNGAGNPADAVVTAPGGGRFASDFVHFNPLDRYNFSPVNYLQQPATRNNIFGSGRFDITDNVSAFARVSYTQRLSSQQLAQVPATFATDGRFGPQWAFGIAANNVFNPFGVALPRGQFRNVAVGPRHNNYDFNVIGSTAGLQGAFKLGDHNFDWEVYAQYNDDKSTKIGLNYINLFNLKKALGPSFRDATGNLVCGTPAAPITNCVPFNVFGGPDLGVGAGIITPAEAAAMINYVSYTQVAAQGIKGINYGANLSGEIAPLQGGMLSFAAGLETRRERAFFQPDALVAGGGSSDNFTEATSGQTKVDEAYLELDAPILKGLPGAQELEFNIAARKSRYSANGIVGVDEVSSSPGNPLNKKYSLRWKPITDLLLRASYGDTFRAPSVNDLFAGGSENFPAAQDPCNTNRFGTLSPAGQALCIAQGVPAGGVNQDNSQIRALSGGNPLLTPEHGKNFTAGFVYSPSWVSGLNITADYWRVNLKDVLSFQSAQSILNLCFAGSSPGNPQFCDKVIRVAGGNIQEVRTAQFNASSQTTDGIDFGFTYKHDTGWGTFGVKWDTTYVKKDVFDGINLVGWYTGGPNWKWRSIATLDWQKGDWDASWTARYTSKMDELFGCTNGPSTNTQFSYPICNHPNDKSNVDSQITGGATGFNRIGAVVYHDVQIGWKAPWKAHLAIGARNVFGKEPPYTANSFANSFDASYDLPGGPFYYFQYRQDF
jgi:iron complex outermembrane receptor protein